jgi:hypothetical protein
MSQAVSNLFNRSFSSQGTVGLWNSGFAKILLSKNIGSNLAPLARDFDIVHFKYNFPAGIAYYTGTIIIFELIKYTYIFVGEAAAELQAFVRLLFTHKLELLRKSKIIFCLREENENIFSQ